MTSLRLACLLGACAVIASSVRAQESTPLPERLTLPVLLKLVAERSPRLAAERVAIDAAAADRISASALPNPTLSYGRFKPASGANTLFDGSRQQQVTVDMPLLIANQRGSRIEAAEQAITAARAHVDLAGAELGVRAAETFIGLQAAQERVAVLEAALAEVQRLNTVVAGRLASGMASRYELTRLEVERAALAARLDDARIERTSRAAGLAALLGVADWRPTAIGEPRPAGLPAAATAWRSALAEGNAQILAGRRDEDSALAALRRAERERIPVPVLSLGRQWTSEPFGAANFVGLSTEIPLLDRRLGPVAKAEAELRAAKLRREATEAEVGAELARLLQTLSQRQAALAQYEREIGARISDLREMAEAFYQLGRGSVLELLDAARSRLDSSLAGAELRALATEQEMRILALTGQLGRDSTIAAPDNRPK